MNTHLLYSVSETKRVRWVYDEIYETHGSYCYDTEEETRAAEAFEYEMLSRGEWVALGCIVEELCPHCRSWSECDSLWGIVIEPDDATLKAFAKDNMVGVGDE